MFRVLEIYQYYSQIFESIKNHFKFPPYISFDNVTTLWYVNRFFSAMHFQSNLNNMTTFFEEETNIRGRKLFCKNKIAWI